jgi:hypothetical protein
MRHALLSTQYFSFSTFSELPWNTAGDSSGHSAVSYSEINSPVRPLVPYTQGKGNVPIIKHCDMKTLGGVEA